MKYFQTFGTAKLFIILISALYILFSAAGSYFSFTYGIVLVVLSIIALREANWRQILSIFSPVIIYPLFLYFTFLLVSRTAENGWLLIWSKPFNLAVLAIFLIIYLYVFNHYWDWIRPELKTTLVASYVITGIVGTIYAIAKYKCVAIASMEKGVSLQAVHVCQSLQSYVYSAQPAATQGLIVFSFAGPILIAVFLIGKYFFSTKVKNKKSNYLQNSK